MRGAAHVLNLPVNIAGVLDGDFHLLDHRGHKHIGRARALLCLGLHRQVGVGKAAAGQAHQVGVAHFGAAQQIGQAVFMLQGFAKHALRFLGGQVFRADPQAAQALGFT